MKRAAFAWKRFFIVSGTIGVTLVIIGGIIGYQVGLQPVSSTGAKAQDFRVEAGESAPHIARRLAAAGLIRDRTSFVTYINIHGLRPRLKAGLYAIDPNLSARQIARLIASGQTLSKHLLVPEGYRLSQIEDAAAAEGITKADFAAALAAPHSQSFLAGKPAGVSLEGYLFPDSYQVNTDTTASGLVTQMLDTFGRRVGPEYTQAFAAEGLTLHQGLTLASIVEKEVNIAADRPIVAQIFLKRLKMSMPLGSDVTTEYAAKLKGVPFSIEVDSPYNTRRYAGLPPGPIASPGLGAMDAVAHPAATEYLYFLSGKDGKTYYAKTYPEHQANIVKYLQ